MNYTDGTMGFAGFGLDRSYDYHIEVVRENFGTDGIVKVKGTVEQQLVPNGFREAEVCIRLDVTVTADDEGEPKAVTTYSVDGMDKTYNTLTRAIEVASDECLSELHDFAMQMLNAEIEGV